MTEHKYIGYKRDEASYFNAARSFTVDKLRMCPICGKSYPKWLWKEEFQLMKEQYGVFGRMYHFLCPDCESILKIREGDVSGYACSKSTFEGMMKRGKGKDNLTIYVIIEKIGEGVRSEQNADWEGKEFPLPELLNKLKKD